MALRRRSDYRSDPARGHSDLGLVLQEYSRTASRCPASGRDSVHQNASGRHRNDRCDVAITFNFTNRFGLALRASLADRDRSNGNQRRGRSGDHPCIGVRGA
jgi:hypothetical protein